jgi:hypothetical protein
MKKRALLLNCPKLNKSASRRYLMPFWLKMTKTMGSARLWVTFLPHQAVSLSDLQLLKAYIGAICLFHPFAQFLLSELRIHFESFLKLKYSLLHNIFEQRRHTKPSLRSEMTGAMPTVGGISSLCALSIAGFSTRDSTKQWVGDGRSAENCYKLI